MRRPFASHVRHDCAFPAPWKPSDNEASVPPKCPKRVDLVAIAAGTMKFDASIHFLERDGRRGNTERTKIHLGTAPDERFPIALDGISSCGEVTRARCADIRGER